MPPRYFVHGACGTIPHADASSADRVQCRGCDLCGCGVQFLNKGLLCIQKPRSPISPRVAEIRTYDRYTETYSILCPARVTVVCRMSTVVCAVWRVSVLWTARRPAAAGAAVHPWPCYQQLPHQPQPVKERCRFFRDKRDTHLSDSVIPVLTLTPRNSPSLTPVCDVNRGRRRVTLTGPVGVCQRVFCGAPARWIEPQQAAQEAQQRGAASGCQSAWQRVGVWVVGRAPPLHRGPVRQPLRP